MLKRHLFLLILVTITCARADLLQFEGPLPPDVDKPAMNAEYFRLYRLLAARQRPDMHPVHIVYLTGKESATREYGLPEWGGGGAIGSDLIVIPTAAKPFLDLGFAQITRHELVHIVLNRAYPSCGIPRWFHEGAAMTLSGELSFEENVIVSKAIFSGRLQPLSSIDSVNAFGRNRADLAYCQSHLSVLFLIDQYGIEVLSQILASARKTGSFWQGVNAVLSITPQEFEQAVRAYITSRYRLVFLIADYPTFWVVIVLLFLAASVVAIVRKRRKLDLMERLEQQDATGGQAPGKPGDTGVSEPKHFSPAPRGPFADEKPGDGNFGPEVGDDDDDYVLGDGIELEDDDEDDDADDWPPEKNDRPPQGGS
jgi:Peptidase MA superfamily